MNGGAGTGSAVDAAPRSVAELEERLSRPGNRVLTALRECPGDVVVLGAGGKMGPTLSRMAARALEELDRGDRVIAVSRFGSVDQRRVLEAAGVETVSCDITHPRDVAALPDAPNIIYLAGQKFGTQESPASTWSINVVAASLAAGRYSGSRIVALSTGNVYPFVRADSRAPTEDDLTGPVGEYAWSCLGRERVLEHAAQRDGTRVAIVRLNYANDLRYGVITDLALSVAEGRPIDLTVGWVNVIWQGDANARVLACLPLSAVPSFVLNVTGPERLSVRELAAGLGRRLSREPVFTGSEGRDALLSDASRSVQLFGAPELNVETLLDWTAEWVRRRMPLLGKPTHFETRDGAF